MNLSKPKGENYEKPSIWFSFLNGCTGGCRTKSFWASGDSEESCKKNAWEQAKAYDESLTDRAYKKACGKAMQKNDYLPSATAIDSRSSTAVSGNELAGSGLGRRTGTS